MDVTVTPQPRVHVAGERAQLLFPAPFKQTKYGKPSLEIMNTLSAVLRPPVSGVMGNLNWGGTIAPCCWIAGTVPGADLFFLTKQNIVK